MSSEPEAASGRPATAPRSPLATAPRQLILVIVTTAAVAFWLSLVIVFHRRSLRWPVTTDVVLEGLTSDGLAERWYAYVSGLLLYGHLPLLALLACWGAGLVVHSTVRTWHEPLAEQVKVMVGEGVVLTPGLERVLRREPSGYVPPTGTFWGAVFAGAFAVRAALASATLDGAPFWDHVFGPTLWVALLWWAVAALVGASAAGLHLRRRRYLRTRHNRPRLGKDARGQPLVTRPPEPRTDEEKRADGLFVGAVACAVFGLGPLGLVLGVRWLRHTTTGWGGLLVLVLNSLSTLVMAVALVLAVVAG